MSFNYNNKTFRTVDNSSFGETSSETLFRYQQHQNIVSATYSGGKIALGQLIGIVDQRGCIDIRYHQVNYLGELRTGVCHSIPELLPDGKIRLYETWQWTSGDGAKGDSVIEEI